GILTPWSDTFTTLLPTATVGTPYVAQPQAVGGVPPYSWSQSGLPSDMQLDPFKGAIFGTPRAPATSTVVVAVKDSDTPPNQASVPFDYLAMRCYAELPPPVVEYLGSQVVETPQGVFVRHNLSVTNNASFPDDLFFSTPRFGVCGQNPTPARTWVDVFDAGAEFGSPLNTFCALGG